MRYKFYSIFLIVLFIVTTNTEASDLNSQKAFEDRYAEMSSAMKKHDWVAVRSLHASDFVSIDPSGKRESLDQVINLLKSLPPNLPKDDKTTVNSVHILGEKATVKQSWAWKTKKASASGRMDNIEFTASSEDIWIKSNGAWVIQSTTTKQTEHWVNGKLVERKILKK